MTDARADFESATVALRAPMMLRMDNVLRSMREASGMLLLCLECGADVDHFPHAPFCSEAA